MGHPVKTNCAVPERASERAHLPTNWVQLTHHSEPLPGVEDGQLVPPEALDLLEDEREMR